MNHRRVRSVGPACQRPIATLYAVPQRGSMLQRLRAGWKPWCSQGRLQVQPSLTAAPMSGRFSGVSRNSCYSFLHTVGITGMLFGNISMPCRLLTDYQFGKVLPDGTCVQIFIDRHQSGQYRPRYSWRAERRWSRAKSPPAIRHPSGSTNMRKPPCGRYCLIRSNGGNLEPSSNGFRLRPSSSGARK